MTTLHRVQREQRQRRAHFTDVFNLELIASAADDCDVLMLTGHADHLPGDDQLINAALKSGLTVERYINVSERVGERRLAVTYRLPTGRRIEVRSAAEWFGPDLSPALCARAWQRLRDDLAALFGPHAVLLTSPAQTGHDLLERSLPRRRLEDGTREPYEFPSIPAPLAAWLYATQGQGRTELFPHSGTLGDLYGIDGVWMYASCLSRLPAGPLVEDRRDAPPGHAPGFLLASVRVPDDWAHVGLLPEQYSEGSVTRRRYPRAPGQWFSSAMTTSEYAYAALRGWDIRIKSRYLWPEVPCDLARPWRDKLVAVREGYRDAASRGDVVAGALAGTVRRLMLTTIGLWFSHEATTDSYLPRRDLPALLDKHPDAHVSIRGKSWAYVRLPRTANPATARPEWAASVWGRARAKLARAACALPYETLVSLRTDAIWSTANPQWRASSHPGDFRLKELIDGPCEAPASDADMRLLLSRARSIDEWEVS